MQGCIHPTDLTNVGCIVWLNDADGIVDGQVCPLTILNRTINGLIFVTAAWPHVKTQSSSIRLLYMFTSYTRCCHGPPAQAKTQLCPRDSNPGTIFNPGITKSSWFMHLSIFQGLQQLPVGLLMCTLLSVFLSTAVGLSKAIVFACRWYDVMMSSADYPMKYWMLIDKLLL